MLQVHPDWSMLSKSKVEIEHELTGFTYRGPGLYLSDVVTVLVLPVNIEDVTTLWYTTQPDDTLFDLYVWNCRVSQTIVGAAIPIPTRKDDRAI